MTEMTDEQLLDDLLVEIGSTVSKGGYANYYSDKRKALSERMAVARMVLDEEERKRGRAEAALQEISLLLGGSDEWADQASMIADVVDLVKNTRQSVEAVAQAYRAGFKAGKVWAEPVLPNDKA
jgi:hypothetical protein